MAEVTVEKNHPDHDAETSTFQAEPFTYHSPMGWRRPTYRSLSSLSPRSHPCHSMREAAEAPHFLHACALCKKPLGPNNDIFMYRGDIPFCSEECRQEQIDRDEAKERKWGNLTAKALARKEPNKESIHVRATETVVAG